jgi:tetratricopeptide (TPR) repeat protein
MVPGHLYFSFYASRYRAPRERAIILPTEHIWWMTEWQDLVLLSDGLTHHYTAVARVDRDNDRIYFQDPWQQRFFLLAGRNRFGIKAQVTPAGLSVSKQEFLRAVVGLVTRATPELINAYLAAFPEQRLNPDLLIRCGYMVLDDGDDLLAGCATVLFKDAAALATSPGEKAIAIRQGYLAASCAAYVAQSVGDARVLSAMQAAKAWFLTVSQEEAIEDGLTADELGRLGYTAGRAGEYLTADRLFTRAIDKDPLFERGYALRAIARVQKGDHADAAADARRALDINATEVVRLENGAASIKRVRERSRKQSELAATLQRRKDELAALLSGLMGCGDIDAAREVAQSLVVASTDATNYGKLGVVEHAGGRWPEAAAAFSQAFMLETNLAEKKKWKWRLYEALDQTTVPRSRVGNSTSGTPAPMV